MMDNYRGRALGVGLVSLVVGIVLGTAPGSPVAGSGVVSAPALASSADLEQVIEEYDKVSGLLVIDRARAVVLGRSVASWNAKLAAAQRRLLPVVRQTFEVGNPDALRILLDVDTTAALVDQWGMAEAMAHRTRATIAAYTAARDKDATARKALQATIATLAARQADLAAKKRTILAGIAAQQALAGHVTDLSSPTALKPVACPAAPVSGPAAIAVRVACAQIGKPYLWAAAGPNRFDCSGLMVYAWAAAGKHLRHYTGWQWQDATPVTAAQLRPGDLVFFFPPTMHHVGMYVGAGWIVDAPHTGDVVRMERMDLRPIGGYRRP